MSEEGSDLEGMFTQMRAEMRAWREAHPDATLDEIAAKVMPHRRQLLGAWLAELALQQGNGYAFMGLRCEQCGEALVYKGAPERDVLLVEGDLKLARAYYHCPHCEHGVFPPGSPAEGRLP